MMANLPLAIQVICVMVGLILLIVACVYITMKFKMWQTKGRQIVLKKCQEYVKNACYQAALNFEDKPRVILGEDVSIHIYPHMAFIQLYSQNDPKNTGRVCGGTLISKNFILSAAHCIHGIENPAADVKLGSSTRNLTDGTGEIFGMKNAFLHPQFRQGSKLNDIALIELDRIVKFSSTQRPICLNTNYTANYDHITATGWGYTGTDILSQYLQTVELQVNDEIDAKCEKALKTSLNKYLICAGHPEQSKCTHLGDSGGPLQIPLKNSCGVNTYEQIGITSQVESGQIIRNQTLLSLYTTIEPFIPWIASTVWPNEF